MARDPYLYVAPGADEARLAEALRSVDPDLECRIYLDEFAGNPDFNGFPTLVAFDGERHWDPTELATRLRALVPWQVVSLPELEHLAARAIHAS